MKQKIVVKVVMTCDKCRSKAMKFAAVADGVSSVAVQGKDNDELVVIGDGVDSVCLTKRLRKKVGYARIVSVEEVKAKKVEEVKAKKVEEVKEDKKPDPIWCYTPYAWCYTPYACPQYPVYEVVYDPSPSNCTLM